MVALIVVALFVGLLVAGIVASFQVSGRERDRETLPCGWETGDCAAAGPGCERCTNNPEAGK